MTDAPEARIEGPIATRLIAFNENHAGSRDYRPLVVSVAHPETGEVLGGLWGGTSFSYLHIEMLYLPEAMRGAGLGRKIMRQAEQEAARRGCHAAWLDTFSFQARGFYERLGYDVFGVLEDYPPGHSRYFMKKSLTED
jgi:GNAT superfamily N-acetyltransferase